jgi:hypothetical protein
MKRREFLKTSTLTGAAALTGWAASSQAQESGRDLYEVRVYDMPNGNRRNILRDYLSKAAIPAWNRIGIKPVGAFSVLFGGNNAQLYVLIPYANWEAFLTAPAKLAADAEYQKAATEYVDSAFLEPAYHRYQSTLLLAFKNVPHIRIPAQTGEKKPRIFELRTYESHSEKIALKKIEMFNEGGEIALFDSVGLKSVFFGQTLIGQRQPNLMYMTVHDDMTARDKVWGDFGKDPGWKKLSGDPAYANTVSTISIVFLRPTEYSQI